MPETVVNETAVETKTEQPVEKKPRKPREKVRPLEEIVELPVTKLTDKEKDTLIKHLKEEVNMLIQKSEACKGTADAAFEKCRMTEQNFNNMEDFYRRKLKYVDTQLEAFHSAINAAIKGGNN